MTSDASTNAGKHVISNIARIQNRFSLLTGPNDIVLLTLHNFPPFIGQNVISDGPTNWLSIRHCSHCFDAKIGINRSGRKYSMPCFDDPISSYKMPNH